MTPKRFLLVLSALSLGTVVSACGSSSLALRTGHRKSTAHAATMQPATPTSAAPTGAPPSTASVPTTAPSCSSNLADQLASTGRATQLITVDAPGYGLTSATFSAWERQGSCWVAVYGPWIARIGANGFSDHHVEGDNTTPTGAYGIGSEMYGNAPNPGVQYPYQQVVCGDWWDEDPSSPEYNTFQYVPCGETPSFGGDSEALWEETGVYPSFAVIDYNTSPVVPGAGSAIFIAANLGSPTEGCVGLPVEELDQLLRWLNPAAFPLVVLGPDSEITNF
jgi:L,D-peptidoglycan transpeptidase YkuD (ErfK/YbiS/YcfS/YnhG family)